MASNNRDEILSKFIAITQCSSDKAREYLEAAQWNEEAAMDFFFDSSAFQARDSIPPTQTRLPEPKSGENVPG
jgi:hypothetical protein